MRNTRPRTFNEVVAAQDPTEMARLERGDHFVDPSVNAFHGGGVGQRDRSGTGEWRVITSTMTGAATRRARDYYNSLKAGRLRREPLPQ